MVDDIACEDVNSPAKRGTEAYARDGKSKWLRVQGDDPHCTGSWEVAGERRSNNELDVDLNVAGFLAVTPERNNTDAMERPDTVVWDNEPTFDLGIFWTPPRNLDKDPFASQGEQGDGGAGSAENPDGNISDHNNGSSSVTSSCESWCHDSTAGGSNDVQAADLSLQTPNACASDSMSTPGSSVADSVPPYWWRANQIIFANVG